jgi:hypothetical protein
VLGWSLRVAEPVRAEIAKRETVVKIKAMSKEEANIRGSSFGWAWLFLCFSLVLHAWDEQAHSFLLYYNATALTLYGHLRGYFPRIDLEYNEWLGWWVLVILAGLSLAPWAFRNSRWMRRLGVVVAISVFLFGAGFVFAQILDGTVGSVRFAGAAPGIYSAPLLLAAAGLLFWRIKESSTVGVESDESNS